MAAILENLNISYRSQDARRKQNLIDIACIFINPVLAFLLLIIIVYEKAHSVDNAYLILGGMAFAFLFPGNKYINEPIQKMINKILLNWLFISTMLLFFVHLTEFSFNNTVLLDWLVSTPLMLIAVNSGVRLLIDNIFSSENNLINVVIVGCSSVGLKLGKCLKNDNLAGMNLAGYFDDRSYDRLNVDENELLGSFSDLATFCNTNPIEQIFVCMPQLDNPRIGDLLGDLKDTTASIYFVPDIFVTDLIQSGISHNINGIPVVSIRETPLIGLNALQKRLMDIIFSLSILLLFSPVLIWIAYKIKQTSRGPVIFVQRRYGIDGQSINVYKFRTMKVTENGDDVYKQVDKNDTRVTEFGAFLRKTSLDEFPQFINVLQGRMSIVGPRPHVVAVNETYRKLIPGYMIRHKVKPGITGWAQVNGFRGGDDLGLMQRRVEHDLEYLRTWSLGLDFWIILKTAFVVTAGDNAAY